MSTLKGRDFQTMENQIKDAKDKMISKEKVLRILHLKLEDVDNKNELTVDKIDGVAIKEILNSINNIEPSDGKF